LGTKGTTRTSRRIDTSQKVNPTRSRGYAGSGWRRTTRYRTTAENPSKTSRQRRLPGCLFRLDDELFVDLDDRFTLLTSTVHLNKSRIRYLTRLEPL